MAHTSLNFITGAARPAPWALFVLSCLAAAAVASGTNWALQQRAVVQLEQSIVRAQPRIAPVAPMSAAARQQHEQQVKIVGEAVRQLNVPVTRLIKMVQAPADIHVSLLALDLNLGTLKISGEAEAGQDMMNYVAYLSEQPLFSSVYLVKHEQTGNAYRFQLEAQWRE
jgi:Tfp pilus assembly protein PilN